MVPGLGFGRFGLQGGRVLGPVGEGHSPTPKLHLRGRHSQGRGSHSVGVWGFGVQGFRVCGIWGCGVLRCQQMQVVVGGGVWVTGV